MLYFCFRDSHFFKSFPVQDVDRTALIHQNFSNCEFVYVHSDYHGIILGRVDRGEVIVSERNWGVYVDVYALK